MYKYGKRREVELAMMQWQEKEKIKNMAFEEFSEYFKSMYGIDLSDGEQEIKLHRLAMQNCVTLTQAGMIEELSPGWLCSDDEYVKICNTWVACNGIGSSSQCDGVFVFEPSFENENPVIAIAGWLILRKIDESLPA